MNVSADFVAERVMVEMSADEARGLAQTFDRASRLPNGMVGDAGWLELSEALIRAAGMADDGTDGDAGSDDEITVSVRTGQVRMGIDAGSVADDVADEIETDPEAVAAAATIAEDIRACADDLARE